MNMILQNLTLNLTPVVQTIDNNRNTEFRISPSFMVFALMLAFGLMTVTNLALAAPYVDPSSCGGNGQPACYISAAKYLGKVKKDNPGGGAFKDLRKSGEWWTCAGWKRTLAAVTAKNACGASAHFLDSGTSVSQNAKSEQANRYAPVRPASASTPHKSRSVKATSLT